ncbi:MAG: type II toxin-antitoxin system VapC family toxin [Candidatus Brockarchaeota archaeon]|nr:type II toxin-antitoxin system VapC family toxin [Candidatus Brockarchaeota archaeon]MBO3808837.1 type II toxin-antitoxin system VapC family toxin [Candidatus Brockarchaeota archaeon]
MKLLYDASALLNVIRLRKQDAYRLLKDSLILCLAKYEIGNALWKEALLQRRISVEEAFETMVLLDKVLKIMRVVDLSNNDLALKLAYDLQTTFYDASYIVASTENNAKLVTDDMKLARKIRENTSIMAEILKKKPETSSSDRILNTS